MALLTLDKLTKIVSGDGNGEKILLDHVDLSLAEGDFVTVLGNNGAGKSTLFNLISGSLRPTSGRIILAGTDITQASEAAHARLLSRVFQDPKLGTAPRMTVAENLSLAELRGQKRALRRRSLKEKLPEYERRCAQVGNGLERQLNTPAGELSGGQRQALSLLMATMVAPKLLLLDEHTAALDPKSSAQLMQLTAQLIKEQHLTCLMITHRLDDALKYGDRLLLLQNGRLVKDLDSAAKKALTRAELLSFFKATM